MKKYILVAATVLFTSAAVTATVLASKEKPAVKKEVKKVEKKKSCTKVNTHCFFS
ncbi:MAG TPA: hypothetical protein VNA26_09100 [Chitinophagaceae bacterium]|nr:hypothetical protein [Chitinophagaceae bacterium]